MIHYINIASGHLKTLIEGLELSQMETKVLNGMEIGRLKGCYSLDILDGLELSMWVTFEGCPYMVQCENWSETNFALLTKRLEVELDNIGLL